MRGGGRRGGGGREEGGGRGGGDLAGILSIGIACVLAQWRHHHSKCFWYEDKLFTAVVEQGGGGGVGDIQRTFRQTVDRQIDSQKTDRDRQMTHIWTVIPPDGKTDRQLDRQMNSFKTDAGQIDRDKYCSGQLYI